jgi:hypothetical protein
MLTEEGEMVGKSETFGIFMPWTARRAYLTSSVNMFIPFLAQKSDTSRENSEAI